MKYTAYYIVNRVFYLSFLLYFSQTCLAQSLSFKHQSFPDPYNDGIVTDILQDQQGKIWLTTQYGVFCYDGWDFQLHQRYKHTHFDQATTLFVENQRIWVGYEDGEIWMIENQSLKPWNPEEGLPKKPIVQFAQDNNGFIWIATYGEGIYCWDKTHLYNFDEQDGLLSNEIYNMISDPAGAIWCGTDLGINICTFKDQKKEILTFRDTQGLTVQIVKALLPAENGNLWIGLHEGGIIHWDRSKQKITQLFEEWEYGSVISLAHLSQHELWIGTERNGLYLYSLQDSVLRKINHESIRTKSTIHDLLRDDEGNVWVATSNSGFSMTNRLFYNLNCPTKDLQTLLVDSRNRTWLGTSDGLFQALSGEFFECNLMKFEPVGNQSIISLHEDDYGNLWCGTFGNGIMCIHPDLKSIRIFNELNGLPNGSILSIAQSEKQIWLATLGGVFTFEAINPFKLGILPVLKINKIGKLQGLDADFNYKVFADRSGRIWFGTDGNGIASLDGNIVTQYRRIAVDGDSLDLQSIFDITEDYQGNIWFTDPQAGLILYDSQHFKKIDISHGIRDLEIASLHTINDAILIAHSQGLDWYQPGTGTLKYYDLSEANLNFEPVLHGMTVDNHKNVIIAGTDQLYRFSNLYDSIRTSPFAYLRNVSVSLDSIQFSSDTIFNPNENNFLFEFNGIWHTAPDQVKYRYQLMGYDDRWHVTSDRQAVFPKLIPGKYQFNLEASESDQFNEQNVISYSFKIRLPYWKTPWFIFTTTFVLTGLIILILKKRDRIKERAAMILQEKVQNELAVLKSQINPHFLFNSFNTLMTLIKENQKQATEYVAYLSDFYRSITQYREQSSVTLEEEINMVGKYMYLLKMRFGEKISYTFDLRHHSPKWVVPMSVQLLVENAVKHNAITKTHPLEIRIVSNNHNLIVTNNLKLKITKDKSTGFGLKSINRQYYLLTGQEIKITATETSFTVKLPLLNTSK